jgi:hypothetical protein
VAVENSPSFECSKQVEDLGMILVEVEVGLTESESRQAGWLELWIHTGLAESESWRLELRIRTELAESES